MLTKIILKNIEPTIAKMTNIVTMIKIIQAQDTTSPEEN